MSVETVTHKESGEAPGQRAPVMPRGKVYLVEDRCKGCGLCIAFCPKQVLVRSDSMNSKGYHTPELVEEPPDKVCIGCGMCERICPDFAIFVKRYTEGEDGN